MAKKQSKPNQQLELEKILKEQNVTHNGVYGSRDDCLLTDYRVDGKYGLALAIEHGVDIYHMLYLINIQDAATKIIAHQQVVRNPRYGQEKLEIVNLKDKNGVAEVKYRVKCTYLNDKNEYNESEKNYSKKYQLSARTEVIERKVTDFKEIQ